MGTQWGPSPPQQPSALSAHVYCGQTVAHLSNCWALVHRLHISRLGSVTARHSSSERQPNFAALNRGRHLCSAGRPSRLGIGPHSSFSYFVLNKLYDILRLWKCDTHRGRCLIHHRISHRVSLLFDCTLSTRWANKSKLLSVSGQINHSLKPVQTSYMITAVHRCR